MINTLTLTDPFSFEWDEGNINHISKHKVEYLECEEVFYDDPVFFKDEGHSTKEKRLLVYGITNETRMMTLVFTLRKDKIRIVSARDQSKKERVVYSTTLKVGDNA